MILVLVFVNLVSFLVLAQPTPPGDPGGGGNPSVPITGIEFLVGGGLIFGFKKVLSKIKSKKE
ncbi:MAG TPA: hypothetical protein PLD02_09375 [Saprospiraceae bacterium]|nr:hypothetical protein [Saprospiraceae bacterium]